MSAQICHHGQKFSNIWVCSLSFNNESTINFYKRMYHLVTTSLKNLDEYFTIVIPHACLSHIIKDAKTEIKRR